MTLFREIGISDAIYDYIMHISVREDERLKSLREGDCDENTKKMQSSPEQAGLICFLANLIGAKTILEVGAYKGYTSLAMALSSAGDCKITVLERNPEWAAIAQKFWNEAGMSGKITLKLGDAIDSLNQMLESKIQPFDMIFIDADKRNYIKYYEASLKLLRQNGLIIIDNILWGGDVVNKNSQDKRTHIIRELNELIRQDDRVETSLIPMRDGISLVRKK